MIRWSWLCFACLSLFIYGLADNSRGPVYPDLLREFRLNDSNGSLFFLFYSAAAVLNNILLVKKMESWGAYKTIVVYTLVQAIAFSFLGFSRTYFFVLVSSIVLGFAAGGLAVGQNSMVSQAAPPSYRRQAFSALHCMYGASSLVAPLLVTAVYDVGFGWRAVFGLLLAVALGVLCFAFFVPRRLGSGGRGQAVRAFDSEQQPEQQPKQQIEQHLAQEKSAVQRRYDLEGMPEVARVSWQLVSVYAALLSFYCMAEVGLSSRLVLYVRRDLAYAPDRANYLLALFFLGLFLGRVIFAFSPSRIRSSTILAISAAASTLCFSLGLLIHPLWLAICGLSMSVYYPCAIALIHEDFARAGTPGNTEDINHADFVTSWSVTAQCLGLVIMHYAIGALSDHYGLQNALWFGPGCLLVVCFLLLCHPAVRCKWRSST